MTDGIRHAVEGGVSRVTIDRPDVKNAIAPEHRERIIELLEAASADPSIRCVVITGTGDAFCSGAQIGGSGGSAPAERRRGDIARLLKEGAQRLIAAVLDCEKPVIAAVNGVAAGIGAHLALSCDLVVASESARFIEVFVRRGLVPDGGGAYLLVRLLGPQRAKQLFFFGDAVSASEAMELGLVNRVVPDAELDPAVAEWADRLASGPTRTIALTKRLVNAAHDVDRDAAFDAEAWAQEENMGTHDAQEGIRAFVERRKPEFEGR